MKRFLIVVTLAITFASSLRAQPSEQCSEGSDSAECRSQAAAQVESQFQTALPSIRVSAVGRVIIFTAPVFSQKNRRGQFEKQVIEDSNLQPHLCGFGFTTVRVRASDRDLSNFTLSCPASLMAPTAALDAQKHEIGAVDHGSTATFDQGLSSLPPGFKGDDPKMIADRLSTITTKSEFETTAQFEQRKQAAGQSFLKSFSSSGDLIFVVPHEAGKTYKGWEVKYDADAQKLRVTVYFYGYVKDENQHLVNTVALRSEGQSAGEHLASNAFGATTVVSSSIGQEYGVAVSPDTWLFQKRIAESHLKLDLENNPLDLPTYQLNVTMPANEAAAIKPNLSVLFVCKLTEPKVIDDLGGHQATLDDPYETVIVRKYLPVEIKQVWLYDAGSGKVLQKRDATTRSGSRVTGFIAFDTSSDFFARSFLIDIDDIGVGRIKTQMAGLADVVSDARSRAKKKREQLEAENSCMSGVRDILSDAKIWFGHSAHTLSTNTVEYDGLPSATYLLLVVGRSGAKVGVWSGSVAVAEDSEYKINVDQVVLCDDPNGEVSF